MPDHDITCRRLTDLTTDYLDEAMSPRMRTVFEQHLVVCDPCIAHLEQVRVTRQVLRSLPRPPVASAAVAAMLAERDG